MNQSTMRQLEKWAGIPTCAFLTLVRSVLPRTHRPARPKKILLLKLIGQGASVLAYSAIETAIRKVGKQNVYFWVFEENRAIVSLLGLIPEENLLIVSHKSLGAFVRTLVSSLWKIRRAKIDTVVDMEFYSRASAILSYLSGARTRVGLHRFTNQSRKSQICANADRDCTSGIVDPPGIGATGKWCRPLAVSPQCQCQRFATYS